LSKIWEYTLVIVPGSYKISRVLLCNDYVPPLVVAIPSFIRLYYCNQLFNLNDFYNKRTVSWHMPPLASVPQFMEAQVEVLERIPKNLV